MKRLVALTLCALAAMTAPEAHGQGLSELLGQDESELGTAEEMDAVRAVERRKFVRARELATSVLEANPDSIPGNFAMAAALHYGDGNLPRALFLIRKARALLEKQEGRTPTSDGGLYWYQRILVQEAYTAADMDLRDDQLKALARRDEVFGDNPGDHIWANIKLERWDEARRMIGKAIEHENPNQVFRGMNGLCALEFELRNREAGYEACGMLNEQFPNNEVAWSNTAESALTALRHAEAERAYLKATELRNNSYGSPWRSLAMIYLLEGRVTETLSALKQAQKQRMRRPSYTHQQDQASMDMATASLMVALGRGEDAERLGRRVYEHPDRAGGTSASQRQIEMAGTLLFWNALQMRLAQAIEARAALPWYKRLWPDADLRRLELETWTIQRRAITLMASEDDLIELLRPHLLGIVNIEIWQVGGAVRILGAGVAAEAVRRTRDAEDHPKSDGYLDTLDAEIALLAGDEEDALGHARKALDNLPRAEVLLRARAAAVAGQAAHELDNTSDRDAFWNQALEDFPAVFRLLDMAIPVTVEHQNNLTEDVADALLRSPRFSSEDSGLTVRITGDEETLKVCLLRRFEAMHGCAEVDRKEDESETDFVVRASVRFHDLVMSPKLDLSQADVRSLDGSLATGRARQKVDEVLDDITQ